VKASAAQIRAALAKPGPDIRLYLLHGPDEAGAADLARTLGKAMGPDAERVDLDGAQLKGEP
jgi:DNA polymerase-3 subunit delta